MKKFDDPIKRQTSGGLKKAGLFVVGAAFWFAVFQIAKALATP